MRALRRLDSQSLCAFSSASSSNKTRVESLNSCFGLVVPTLCYLTGPGPPPPPTSRNARAILSNNPANAFLILFISLPPLS